MPRAPCIQQEFGVKNSDAAVKPSIAPLPLQHRQKYLCDELYGVLVLGRALQINAADRAHRRKSLFPCAGQELLHHRRQLLIRTVVVETEGRRCRQGLHVLPPALRRDSHAERHLIRLSMGDSTRYIRREMSVP